MVHVKFLREMRLLSLQYALIKPFEITRKRERQNEERNTYINIFCCQCQSKLESQIGRASCRERVCLAV